MTRTTRTQAIGPLGRAALRRPVRGLRLVTDIDPRPTAVPASARRPDPWVLAAVARQRHHAAERLRKLEAENRRAARRARARAADACHRGRRRRTARPCRGRSGWTASGAAGVARMRWRVVRLSKERAAGGLHRRQLRIDDDEQRPWSRARSSPRVSATVSVRRQDLITAHYVNRIRPSPFSLLDPFLTPLQPRVGFRTACSILVGPALTGPTMRAAGRSARPASPSVRFVSPALLGRGR